MSPVNPSPVNPSPAGLVVVDGLTVDFGGL